MSSAGWFDAAQLLPGERLVRSGAARLRIAARPGWWEGHIVLTTDRLFFLSHAEHPEVGSVALWVSDIRNASSLGRDRLLVSSAEIDLLFVLRGARFSPITILGRQAELWAGALSGARRRARPHPPIEGRRRAAG